MSGTTYRDLAHATRQIHPSRASPELETPTLANDHAFLIGDMMQLQESSLEIRSTRHCDYIVHCAEVERFLPIIGVFLTGVPTILSPAPALTVIPVLILSYWHLDYAVVFSTGASFPTLESSAIAGRRKSAQKDLCALRSACNPECRRFRSELEVGIAVSGAAVHCHRLLNQHCMDRLSDPRVLSVPKNNILIPN